MEYLILILIYVVPAAIGRCYMLPSVSDKNIDNYNCENDYKKDFENFVSNIHEELETITEMCNETEDSLNRLITDRNQDKEVIDNLMNDNSDNKNIIEIFEKKLERLQNRMMDLENKVDPTDCNDIYERGDHASGVRTIFPHADKKPVSVYCDQTSGGGWTVILRRDNNKRAENFYRSFADYSKGFGNRHGEYWLGLTNIHQITTGKPMMLSIATQDTSSTSTRYANYAYASVGSFPNYVLTVGPYSGNAGDALTYSNGKNFTTFDNDIDEWKEGNCAIYYESGWWFGWETHTNLNGPHIDGDAWYKPESMFWTDETRGHKDNYGRILLEKVSMKIRPVHVTRT